MDKIVEEIEKLYMNVYNNRCDIAEYKKQIAEMKPSLWQEADGTVDQKKDYIKSHTAELNESILLCEAEIEKAYNLVEVLQYKLVYSDE